MGSVPKSKFILMMIKITLTPDEQSDRSKDALQDDLSNGLYLIHETLESYVCTNH